MQDSEESSDGEKRTVVVPNVSITVAFVFGIASVLAIVAFIDHAAKTMDVSQLLERITRDTFYYIQRTWEEDEKGTDEDPGNDSNYVSKEQENPTKPQSIKGEEAEAELSDDSHVVRFRTSGWVQEIDLDLLLRLVPENGYIKLYTLEGRYAIPGTAVCTVYPAPSIRTTQDDAKEFDDELQLLDDFDDQVLDAIMIGLNRSMRNDATYGLRQIVDVILRALSPAINDPTTAQQGIFHVAALVTEFLRMKPPKSVLESENGGTLILNEQHDYDSIVRLGFGEVRICAISSPKVALYLLEALRLIRESLTAAGYPNRAPEIERQALMIEEGFRNSTDHIDADRNFIFQAREDRFDTNRDRFDTQIYQRMLRKSIKGCYN
jgi:uncharacterized membrane protein